MSVAKLALRPQRLVDGGILRSSATVFFGISLARLLAFLFYVLAARLLAPDRYGVLAYSFAIVTVASMLVTNAPNGLARFLARHEDDARKRTIFLSNWLAVVALALGASALAFIALSPLTRLSVWYVLAIVLNLVNVAVFETYQQAQRGLGRFSAMAVFYVIANFLQLLVAVVLSAAGYRSPGLFLTVYGLSAFASVLLMELVAPTPVSFDLRALAWGRVALIVRYLRPILIQGAFYGAWWGADVILVQHFLDDTAAGNYAAAKVLAQALIMAPMAVGAATTRRIARLGDDEVRAYVPRLLATAAMVMLPLGVAVMLLEGPLLFFVYGAKYPQAGEPLAVLAAGAMLHGFYLVLSSTWGGLGRPRIGAFATGLGMLATVSTALVVIPHVGLIGGAIGFAAGAATQLLVVGAYSVWALFSAAAVRVGHLPDTAMAQFADA